MKSQRKCNQDGIRVGLRTKMVRCGIFFGAFFLIAGCSPTEQTTGYPAGSSQTSSPPAGKLFRRGIPGEPRTLDPQLADDEFSFPVIRDLFEGLTTESAQGEALPGVAESWTVDAAGTTYTFRIRNNARWSDGEKIVAVEFVNGMRRAVDPKVASGSAGLLSVIKNAANISAGRSSVELLGVAAPDDYTVQIKLEHPAPFILQILSQPVCAPLHNQISSTSNQSSVSESRISNGPYKFVRWIPGAYIEVRRNPMYWNSDRVQIESIRYISETSESTELNQYLAGELEMTSTIPMPDFDRVLAEHASEVQIAPILGTLFLALDVSEPPLSQSRELRKALSMTVERSQITQQLLRGVSPAFSFVANGIKNYTQQKYLWSELTKEQRIAEARTLYERAGYSRERPLHIKLFFNSNDGIRRLMVAIAGGWKDSLGVETELVSTEFRIFLEERKNRKKWDAIRLGWYADYDDPASFLEMFRRSHNQNDAGYDNTIFNQLLERATTESNVARRRAILESAERTLLGDYPIVPIYFYNARRLVKPNIGGATITPMNRTYSKNLYWK